MIQQIHQCQTQRGSGAQKQPPPTSQVSNSKKILIVISNQLCRSERILEEEGTSVALLNAYAPLQPPTQPHPFLEAANGSKTGTRQTLPQVTQVTVKLTKTAAIMKKT